MKYKAVIFDLFGTLVDKFPIDESIDILKQMAAVLEVSDRDMVKLWFETFDERHGGDFRNLEDDTRYVAEKLGASPDEAQIKKAAQINLDYVENAIKPRSDTVETLTCLRERGYKVGLLSNWSHEVPTVWDSVPLSRLFDAAVFSSKVGMLKPDPRIYLMVAEKLEVRPEECLYIGDGASRELAGAQAVGMDPVLIDNKGKDSEHPVNAEAEEWQGNRITSLAEIMTLL
ncbi:HAD family hydrolase [Chloroflexota bacterium]